MQRIILFLCLRDSPLSVYSKKGFIISSCALRKLVLKIFVGLLYHNFTFNLLEFMFISYSQITLVCRTFFLLFN